MDPISLAKSSIAITGKIVSRAAKGGAKSGQARTFNLFRFFKKGLHGYDEIDGILMRLSEEEKCIGILPDMWRKLFKPSEIRQKTFDIHSIFDDFAKRFQKTSGAPGDMEPVLQRLAKSLKKFLNAETQVSFVDAGMFGSVVRIKGGKEDLALKVFHRIHGTTEPFILSRYKLHGQTMELQNAVALNHGLKSSRRARFYLGKATSLGEDGGYMLSEYVKSKPNAKFDYGPFSPNEDFQYGRFVFGDRLSRGNIIEKKVVDFGNITYRFANKRQEAIAKEVFPLICKGDIQKLLELKKLYGGSPDFDVVVRNGANVLCKYLSFPYNVSSYMSCKGSKEVLSALNALGIEFPRLKAYKYFKPEEKAFLKSVGILA